MPRHWRKIIIFITAGDARLSGGFGHHPLASAALAFPFWLCKLQHTRQLFNARIAGAGAMKDEYDFSKAERGRFYRPHAVLVPPPQRSEYPPLPKGNIYDT
jgi:hypothetical protein